MLRYKLKNFRFMIYGNESFMSKSLNLSINAIMFMTLWNVYVWLSLLWSGSPRRRQAKIKRRGENGTKQFCSIMRWRGDENELKCLTNYDE